MPHALKRFTFFLLNSLMLASNPASATVEQAVIDTLRNLVNTDAAKVEQEIGPLIAIVLSEKDSAKYARLLDIRGLAERKNGNYANAISSHHLAFSVYNAIGNRSAAGGALNNLGIVLIRTEQYSEALDYLQKALELVSPEDTVMLKVIYVNMGVAYDYSERTEQAIDAYKTALKYTASLNDVYSMSTIYHNIAVCYEALEKYKEAEEFELFALKYQQKTGNKDLLARIALSLGGLYLQKENIKKAEEYYDIGGRAAEEINSPELKEEHYRHVVELYIKKGDTKRALLYIDSLNGIKAEIFSSRHLKNIAEAETKFKLDLKNREIENLRISKNLSDLQMQRSSLIRNVMIIAIVLILILVFILYRNQILRKKYLQLLEREKHLVESEKIALEKNYEYLQNENMLARFEILKSQVSPHFLFNTLNALSYLIETDAEKAVHFTNAFSKLYRTVLELKDQNLITLEKELNHVESYFYLQLTRFGDNLIVDKQIDQQRLHMKLPPFCIQLAVENAINHNSAGPGSPLKIKIYNSENYLFICNNLQQKKTSYKSTSVGIANIKSRYSFFTDINPEFTKTNDQFVVKLPLLENPV